MLYNGYSETTRWINENPEEYEEVMKEFYAIEDENKKGVTKKDKQTIFKENFSITGLKLFPDCELEEIEIPF